MANGVEIDERQARVVEALQSRSAKLADVYVTALNELASVETSDRVAAGVAVICHCMREVMAGLPAVMSNLSIPRPVPSAASQLVKLPALLAAHPDADLGLDQDLVPVPRSVAQALAMLISTAAQEEGRNRANTATLVTGSTDTEHPAIAQWRDAYKFFVGWAHLDRNHEQRRTLPDKESLLANIRVVEDVIEVRTALFFENLHALDELLAEINGVDEETA